MKVGGGNICFFRYEFLVFGVAFVSNATPCLYFLTFPGSIQAQNLCKSLAGVRWFKVCGACMRKFCTKEKRGCVISHIPHALKGQKLLTQGIALGIIAISKTPCKGKSFMYYL